LRRKAAGVFGVSGCAGFGLGCGKRSCGSIG
jgi:hypothetical protein